MYRDSTDVVVAAAVEDSGVEGQKVPPGNPKLERGELNHATRLAGTIPTDVSM